MKTPYETLGVKKTDSKDKIKKAYRKKSMKAHPDQGGTPEEFDTINRAYRVLVDEDKRARYDKGENIDDILKSVQTQETKCLTILKEMFINIVITVDPSSKNIIKQMRENIEGGISSINIMILNEEGKKRKFESAAKRIKAKGKNNLFKDAATAQINAISVNISSAEVMKKDLMESLKLLEDFSYEIDEIVGLQLDGRAQFGWV